MTGDLFTLTGRINIETKEVQANLKEVEKSAKSTEKAMSGIEGGAGEAEGGMHKLGESLMEGALKFAGIVGAIEVAIKALEKYEEKQIQVAQLGTLFIGNAKQAQELADAVGEIGKELGIDNIQSVAAAYKIVQNQLGSTNEEYERMTKIALELATVGKGVNESLDVSGVVNLLSSAIRTFKMNVGDAQKIADEFFEAIHLGNANINQLAQTFPTVANVAADAGVSFKELLSIIESASKVIPDTGTITASLTMALAQLQDTQAGVGQQFNELFGTTFNQALKQTGSLTEVLNQFNDKLIESGSSLAEAFGARGLKGIGAILSATNDISSGMDKLSNSTGLVQKGIEQIGDMGGLAAGQAKISFEDLFETVGSALAPILPVLTQLFAALNPIITAVVDALMPLINAVVELAPIIGDILNPFLEVFKSLLLFISPLLSALKPVLQVIGYILKGIAYVIKSIVLVAAKAIDLITKILTFGFSGTHFADDIEKTFDTSSMDKADELLNKGGADTTAIENASNAGSNAASNAFSGANKQIGGNSSSGTTVNQNNYFTQPQASLSDINRQQRQANRQAIAGLDNS